MNFEHALEAMRQGKKVRRMSWNDGSYICFNSAGDIVVENGCLFPLFLDWEIYEEPQKEPEMTNETAITLLKRAIAVVAESGVKRIGCCTSENIIKAIQFAIRSLENQNQTKLFFDVGNISEKELEELQRNLKECKIEVMPEKKCECKYNHTVVDDDMQELMKQALVRKFFELEKEDFLHNETQAAIYTMFEIYKILYP